MSTSAAGPFVPVGFARRDSLRVPVGGPADVLALASAQELRQWVRCSLRDLSASGAAIEVAGLDVLPGQAVLVRLLSGDVLLFQLQGEVVRSAEEADGVLYGVRFLAVADTQREGLYELVMALRRAQAAPPAM